jgi:hypothetical protein
MAWLPTSKVRSMAGRTARSGACQLSYVPVRWGPDRRRLGPHQTVLFQSYIKCLSGIGKGSRPDAVSHIFERTVEAVGPAKNPSSKGMKAARCSNRSAGSAKRVLSLERRQSAARPDRPILHYRLKRRAPNTGLSSREGPRVRRLAPGGRRIRTLGPACLAAQI